LIPQNSKGGQFKKKQQMYKRANGLGLDRREYTQRKTLGETLCTYSISGAVADYVEYSDCKIGVLKTGAR
jgi:hypothetical protein